MNTVPCTKNTTVAQNERTLEEPQELLNCLLFTGLLHKLGRARQN